MSDFHTVRAALEAARKDEHDAQDALAHAHQATARLAEEHAAALRRKTRGDETGEIAAQLARARTDEAEKRRHSRAAKTIADEHTAAFAVVADPRQAIAQWTDETPILLLPVRLETRFKSVIDDDGSREELWVRIYPDTCAIDTFEATLSDTELASARRYWTETWAAAGIEAQRRAAWRNLVASHGTGRAAWIVKEFAPAGGEPAKARPQDVRLVIATDAPPPGAQRDALSAYWKSVWLAAGDGAQSEAALQTLSDTPGVGDAAQLIADFVPWNLAAAPATPFGRNEVDVEVVWLILPPAPDTKTRSWASPARVHVMPDLFVVIGYQDDRVVFEAQGMPIPSPLVAGPDPSAPADQQLAHDGSGDLRVPDDMRWMVDFDAAVSVGMGVKVPLDLTQIDLARPLQRVIALGVRLAEDAEQARVRLEELLAHHRYGRAGLAFVPQGTPTNNTDTDGPAGYDRLDDPDAAYDALFTERHKLPAATLDWDGRCDGQWLADALGVDAQAFDRLPHAAGTDLSEARAMNRALWPATFGYAMETMLHPAFDSDQVDATRWFQTHFVTARGMLPSLRIGDQPYGVLPVSAVSQWNWLAGDRVFSVAGLQPPNNFIAFRQGLATLLTTMRGDWSELAKAVSFVGKSGDPHQLLLDIVGLHPSSVEFHQRYAESLEHIFNRAKLQGLAAQIIEAIRVHSWDAAAMSLLRKLGYAGEIEPDGLSKFFFTPANRLNGPIVDDRSLSEQDIIRAYTTDGRNYIEWLIDAARDSFEDLRQERGFKDNASPQSLLYVMLRHALLLGYWDSSLRLHMEAGLLNAEGIANSRREPAFVHIATSRSPSESRFAPLYSKDSRVSGADSTVAEHIGKLLGDAGTQGLADQLAALDLLKGVPTARLERCLAEHIDTASFRLDAWLLGLVNYQLAALRYPGGRNAPGGQPQPRRGIHLGAFGWIENLQRKTAPLQPVTLDDELSRVFGADGQPPLLQDRTNGGYVLAPSINQATTAAILRAGYLANASPENPGALAVNLSSSRVRVALGLIEGIRNGQPLGALLGYRLQRGLHEGHPGLELDRFVAPLRKQFPLVADQMASTKTAEGIPIEAIEANNVIDGLKLVDRVNSSGLRAYPFGLPLPAATPEEKAAIDAEVDGLLNAHDALADLAMAEGVHQAVLGNYDRVAATLDAYAKGTFPPEPEVVRTPRSGIGLTHRVGLHFEAGVNPGVSPVLGMSPSPKARAQAMVNVWLHGVLPEPDQAGCKVEWFDSVANIMRNEIVTQAELELQPIDALYVVTLDGDAALGELEDRILRYVIDTYAPRPDATITISHTARLAAPMKSFFEIAPLVRHLRSLLLRSRPLAPTDIALSGEAAREQDATQTIARSRVAAVRSELDALRQDIENLAIGGSVDDAMDSVIALFEQAARFGLQQVGWGFMFIWRRRVYADLLVRVQDVIKRWDDRLARFTNGLDAYDLPGTTSDEARYRALGQLDLLVARVPIAPRPLTPLAYRNALPARRDTFRAKRNELHSLLATGEPSVAELLADVKAVLPLTDFDLVSFTLDDVDNDFSVFMADLTARVASLRTEVLRRIAAADEFLLAHDSTAVPTARVTALQSAGSALLGEDFKLIPEFSFAAPEAAELANALAASGSGALTQYVRVKSKSNFVVDDWMHGAARVREKLHAWEQATTLSEIFGRGEHALVSIQLPYRAGEGWLAMEFDPSTIIDGERLLYTAHYAGAPNLAATTCGVLVDEWTEVIPARDETVGLSINCDQPGTEPPQTWLLVTPAHMKGNWQWSDLVGALHETFSLARLRAVEPAQVDTAAYARFLPATTTAVTLYGISIAANYSQVNQVLARMPGAQIG